MGQPRQRYGSLAESDVRRVLVRRSALRGEPVAARGLLLPLRGLPADFWQHCRGPGAICGRLLSYYPGKDHVLPLLGYRSARFLLNLRYATGHHGSRGGRAGGGRSPKPRSFARPGPRRSLRRRKQGALVQCPRTIFLTPAPKILRISTHQSGYSFIETSCEWADHSDQATGGVYVHAGPLVPCMLEIFVICDRVIVPKGHPRTTCT